MLAPPIYPSCLHCGQTFSPGIHWPGANFCRLLYLMEFIEKMPGITPWDLALRSHMAYADVSKALTKGRGLDLFGLVPEARAQGGFRYKYSVMAGWRDRLHPGLVDPKRLAERASWNP